MWRIIAFLGRFGNLLLVLFLELIALVIVVTVNKPQREISQGFFAEVSGTLHEFQSSIGGYFNLGAENDKLMAQNAKLEAELLRMRDTINVYRYRKPANLQFMVLPDTIRNDSLLLDSVTRVMLPDSMLPVSGFRLLPCRAVNNSVHLNYNYITINRGTLNGVETNMGIVSPEGIAGQVIGTSPHYALALSVLNKKFRMSVRLSSNSNVGTLLWEGGPPEYAKLDHIPQTSPLSKGDTIVTSGYSTVFPPDYFVGVVDSFDTSTQDGFYYIRVRLATDFRSLDNLYLVRHDFRPEIDTLEKMKSEL